MDERLKDIASGAARPNRPGEDASVYARWEYKIVYVPANKWTSTGLPAEINEEFDRWGSYGWELVSTEAIVRPGWLINSNTVAIVGFFKRRLID